MASGSKSEGSPIRGNLVIAWKTEPSSGGFFILRPGPGQLDELKEIIRLQHERKKGIWPPFDEIEGWGHNITAIDPWRTSKEEEALNGTFMAPSPTRDCSICGPNT